MTLYWYCLNIDFQVLWHCIGSLNIDFQVLWHCTGTVCTWTGTSSHSHSSTHALPVFLIINKTSNPMWKSSTLKLIYLDYIISELPVNILFWPLLIWKLCQQPPRRLVHEMQLLVESFSSDFRLIKKSKLVTFFLETKILDTTEMYITEYKEIKFLIFKIFYCTFPVKKMRRIPPFINSRFYRELITNDLRTALLTNKYNNISLSTKLSKLITKNVKFFNSNMI